ncbi:YqjF family protein [Citricoccus sp. GCM10030269]|uniref:YqjF family protein n=1 Tax=Citricoccus sp. GCM10030269 TaxID=3273388 RepID=UPI00360F142F
MSGRTPDHPVRIPVNFQDWEHLTFLHWPYDVATVQSLVPDELTVQQWDGRTWVGITPFRMVGVRPPGLPPPGWGAFPELNVRAYVRTQDGRDGIWFLGMLVPRRTFIAALGSLGLPYEHSHSAVSMDSSRWVYRFGTPHWLRSHRDDWFQAAVDVGLPLEATERTPLVESITGRWSAYHRRGRVLWRTPVEHEPWPLHAATASGRLTAPLRWAGLPAPTHEPLVHAAPAVHARLGMPRPA